MWHRFEVDGEEYFWRTYSSTVKKGAGEPWSPCETLDVARQPDTPGVGRTYDHGVEVKEADAVETVRMFAAAGRRIP